MMRRWLSYCTDSYLSGIASTIIIQADGSGSFLTTRGSNESCLNPSGCFRFIHNNTRLSLSFHIFQINSHQVDSVTYTAVL